MKILIIDDDIDLLEMTARRITRQGAETLSASNLKMAIEIFQKNQDINGIICDYYLQDGENGLTFYEKYIKGKFTGKFILATGDNSADIRIQQYSSEDKLFCSIEKPYTIDKILEFINV